MRRLRAAPLAALAAALTIGSAGAAGSEPLLVSAAAQRHHVVVTFSLHDAAPGELVVATSPRVDALGALVVGVKLRERVRLSSTSGALRWRSRGVVGNGRYYVQVSALPLGGVIDCVGHQPGCGQEWSNVRQIVVRAT